MFNNGCAACACVKGWGRGERDGSENMLELVMLHVQANEYTKTPFTYQKGSWACHMLVERKPDMCEALL